MTTLEQYDDMLNEVYPTFKIGYMEYYASDIWKAVDPIAYELGFQDFVESISEEEDE